LVLLFFLRAMRGERPLSSAAWSGAFLGIAFLSGHHQIPIFISLAMAGAWLYYLIEDRKKLKLLLIFGFFLALVSAVQTLPAYEYGKLSLRWVGAENPVGWQDKVPYHVHQFFAFYPESILGIVIPGMFRHTDPFAGLVALTLALIAIASNWSDRMTRLFAAVALAGLLLAALLTAWRTERISTTGAIASLALLMLLELGNVTTYSYPPAGGETSLLKGLADHYDLAAFLKDQNEPVRVEIEAND